MHLTSSLLSGELDSYDAEPEGVNEGFSFMKLRSIAVLPSSPDTYLKLFYFCSRFASNHSYVRMRLEKGDKP